MKRKKRKVYAVKRLRIRSFLLAALFIFGCVGAYALGGVAEKAVGTAAVFSAGILMPEGGLLFAKEKIRDAVSAEASAPAVKAETEQTEPPKIEAPAVGGTLAYTPADIAELIKKAEEAAKTQKIDGKISEFKYTAKNATDVYENIAVSNKTAEHSIDIKAQLQKGPDLKIDDIKKPLVLIYHTHTTEGYQPLDLGHYSNSVVTRSKNPAQNMVRVGDEITAQLEKAGIGVIHDKTIFDTTYSGAYYRSEDMIEKYMKQYPSLQVILDIHRDAIKNPSSGVMTKPTAEIGGKKAAQIMIISGCEDGGVTGFPDWEYNLRFALTLQKECEDKYPGLMRPLFFCSRQYNMHKSHCSLLIEMGSDANTLDEAAYSGRLLGDSLASMLKKYAA